MFGEGPRARLVLNAARALCVVVLCVGVVWLARFPFDDAFIHMRIARNLAWGGRPYFNASEVVMGGSSPLWLLLVAGAFRLVGRPAPECVVALECVVLTGLWFTVDLWLAAVWGRRSLLTCLLAFALVAGLALPTAGFLMESPLGALLGVLGLVLLMRDRPALAGLAFAFAAATRYELAVLAGVAWLASPGRRSRGRFLIGFLPVIAAEAALLLIWYGTLVPNTVRAKSIAYPIDIWQFLNTIPAPHYLQAVSAIAWVVGSALLAALTFGPLWRDSTEPARRSVAIAATFSAVLLLLYAAKRTSMFQWYWLNLTLPAALAAVATGLRWLRARAGGAQPLAAGPKFAVPFAVGCIALMTLPTAARSANTLVSAALDKPGKSATLQASLRLQTYFTVADELFRGCPSGTVLTSEIGAVGWKYPGRLVDGLGLVSPEVLKYHPMRVPEQRSNETVGAIPAQAVVELRPDFVVGMEIFLEEFSRRFDAHDPGLRDYRLTGRHPVVVDHGVAQPLWNSNYVLTFSRIDACSK